MKKIISLLLLVAMVLCVFVSCDVPGEKTPDSSTQESNETINSTVLPSSSGALEDNRDEDLPTNEIKETEKNGNQVYFATKENENKYYSELNEYEEIKECFELPKDENGYYSKGGVYFKIINSYDELNSYIKAKDIDKKLFTDNYVICIRNLFWGHRDEKRFVGYYDLAKNGDKYDISLDYYETVNHKVRNDESVPNFHTNYIVVPRSEVEYTEEIVQTTVNGRDDLEGEFFKEEGNIEIDGGYFNEGIRFSHYFISTEKSVALPENATSWVVKMGSDFAKEYGFENHGKYSEREYMVVLYLPEEPTCDFIIRDREIINGNLYLTVDAYTGYTNEYLEENQVWLYDLNLEDTRDLCEGFNVYITVTEKAAPLIPANKRIGASDAYNIAHEHFLENYYDDANPEIGIIGVPYHTSFEDKEIFEEQYKIEGWYVEFGNINEKGDTKVDGYYVVSDYGEIIEIFDAFFKD